MTRNVLIFITTLLITSCTASISVKAQDSIGDPEIYQETLPPAPPGILSPEKDKTVIPRNPTQQAQRIPCDTVDYIVDLVTKQHGEELLFTGNGLFYMIPTGRPPQFAQPVNTPVRFYVDQNSGKWTMIAYSDINQMGCMVANGTNFEPNIE